MYKVISLRSPESSTMSTITEYKEYSKALDHYSKSLRKNSTWYTPYLIDNNNLILEGKNKGSLFDIEEFNQNETIKKILNMKKRYKNKA